MSDKHIGPELDEQELDALFAGLRASPGPAPSDALLARILADAEAEMPRPATTAGRAPSGGSASGGWVAGLFSGLGGWAGVGSLATATVAGVWIGFSGQVAGSDVSDYLSLATSGTVELFPGADDFLATGASEG